MDGKRACGRRCGPVTPTADHAPKNPAAFALAALLAFALALTASPSTCRAQAPSKDVWQTYMDAAAAADQDGDFKTEAITLARALAYAKTHDAQGQRPILSELLLMLAYIELDETDLWHELAKEKFKIDIGNPGPSMREFIPTLDRFGWSFYDRWKAHVNDTTEQPIKQEARGYGAQNSFRLEVALRQKLMSDDPDGLAIAHASLGLVLSKLGTLRDADSEYSSAIELIRDSRTRRNAIPTMSALFGVGDPRLANAELGITANEAAVFFLTAGRLVAAADGLLQSGEDAADAKSPKNLDQFFDTQIGRALELYKEMEALTSEASKFWPHHPFFGRLNAEFAWLYATEFRMTKTHPGRYPDSLSNAKQRYERALAIFEAASGPNSTDVQNRAIDYVALLVAADQTEEAKKVAQRYGVEPPK